MPLTTFLILRLCLITSKIFELQLKTRHINLGSAFPNARYCKNTVRLDILTLLWAYDIEFKQDTAT